MFGSAPVSAERRYGQAAAAKQAEQVELAARIHLIERLLVGKFRHLDDEPFAELEEFRRQLRVSRARQRVDILGSRSARIGEGGEAIGHS